MGELRRDPDTGYVAQRIPLAADPTTGEAVPDGERWVLPYFGRGAGLTVRALTDDEVTEWPVVPDPAG